MTALKSEPPVTNITGGRLDIQYLRIQQQNAGQAFTQHGVVTMAMFSSANREENPKPNPRSNRSETLSILAAGARVSGELEVDGVIKIEGCVEGTVRARGQVLVVKGGKVDGDIIAQQAVIGGEVRGGILADERVEVQATSVVNGDITTPQITVLEGGKINGNIHMEKPNATTKKATTIKEPEPETRKPAPVVGEYRKTG